MIVEFGTMKEEEVGINYSIYKFSYLMTKVSTVCPLCERGHNTVCH